MPSIGSCIPVVRPGQSYADLTVVEEAHSGFRVRMR